VAQAVERGGLREVQPMRRGHVLLERVALAGDREEVKDAAAVIVEQDDRQRQPQALCGQQAADVVRERDVADKQDHGIAGGRRHTEGRRDRPVYPVGAAV
jgi:hypothetical protein